MTMKGLLLLSVLAAFAGLCLAQDVCCVCGGPEPCPAITNPDEVVQLPPDPRLPPGIEEASCALIKQVGEDLKLIPADVSSSSLYRCIPAKCIVKSFQHATPTSTNN